VRIGVYGGTFDPVHYGHLRTALEVRESLALDEVRMLPCRLPAHRSDPGASAEQRRAMLEVALAGAADSGLVLDDRELKREGPSYMVDTLRSFRSEFPEATLCLIIGADAFLGLEGWSRWEQLFELAHIAVMGRPGSENTGMSPRLIEEWSSRSSTDISDLSSSQSGRIYPVEVTRLAISATRIRDLLGRGSSVRFLLPEVVTDYIRQQGLYGVARSG
jgi:nicotinate-nucleotide adenylyltransferase